MGIVVEETQVAKNMTFVPITEIKGSRVVTEKNENLGKIEEIMIDSEQGRIAYIVLSLGGLLGMGNKLLALIPKHSYILLENIFLHELPKMH